MPCSSAQPWCGCSLACPFCLALEVPEFVTSKEAGGALYRRVGILRLHGSERAVGGRDKTGLLQPFTSGLLQPLELQCFHCVIMSQQGEHSKYRGKVCFAICPSGNHYYAEVRSGLMMPSAYFPIVLSRPKEGSLSDRQVP